MSEETLWLPASAAAHWAPACRILHEIWGATDTKPWIGGGTILAARWGHRDSTDLDFKLSWQARIQKYGPHTEDGARLHTAMGTKGYRLIIETSRRLVFEHERSKMRIDLFESTPESRPRRTRLEAPGWGRVEVLDTDEILEGKVQGRLINPPVRDLFDFAIAARVVPQVWTETINTTYQHDAARAVRSWALRKFHYQAQERTQLKGVARQWEHLGKEVWAHACAAVQHATWPRITVRYTTTGAVVQGHGPQGVQHEEPPCTDAEELYERLCDLGVRLDDHKPAIEQLKRRISEGAAGRETSDTVKETVIPSLDEEPLLAPAFERLHHDLDWQRRQEEPWPQYRLEEDEGGLTLLVREDPQRPERTEGQGLSLDALVRRERELRGWPEESEGAIRAFTMQQMQHDRTHTK